MTKTILFILLLLYCSSITHAEDAIAELLSMNNEAMSSYDQKRINNDCLYILEKSKNFFSYSAENLRYSCFRQLIEKGGRTSLNKSCQDNKFGVGECDIIKNNQSLNSTLLLSKLSKFLSKKRKFKGRFIDVESWQKNKLEKKSNAKKLKAKQNKKYSSERDKFWPEYESAVKEGNAESFLKKQKLKTADSRAKADIRSVATGLEVYYVDKERYISCMNQECTNKLGGIVNVSKDVELHVTLEGDYYIIKGWSNKGTGKKFIFFGKNQKLKEISTE